MHHVAKALVAMVMLLPLLQARPASGLSRSYLCFFDEGSAVPSARCELIAGEFVAHYEALVGHYQDTRVEVAAHTDRRENSMQLSNRRAMAVVSFLISRGIPPERIRIEFFGGDRPLVPTARNVREPQNRRVELILR